MPNGYDITGGWGGAVGEAALAWQAAMAKGRDGGMSFLKPAGRERVGRWYTGQRKGTSGGRPSTYEEEAFILDYLRERGHAPTLREVSQWKAGQDARGFTYTPESTMGGMGFKKYAGYREAQYRDVPYGVWAGGEEGYGRLVPEGGLVMTGREGAPLFRTYRPEEQAGRIERGEYVSLPEGYDPYLAQFLPPEGGFPQGGVYPQYDRTPFTPPAMEEALSGYAPEQVYRARLADYITAKAQQDAIRIKEITDRYDAAIQDRVDMEARREIDADTMKRDIYLLQYNLNKDIETEGLMTQDQAEGIYAEATDLINRGTPAEQLPLYAESAETMGAAVQELYNTSLVDAQKQWEAEQESIPEIRGYSSVSPASSWEFRQYIDSLNVSPSGEQWIMENYENFNSMWQEEGQVMPFLQWLNEYLGRG